MSNHIFVGHGEGSVSGKDDSGKAIKLYKALSKEDLVPYENELNPQNMNSLFPVQHCYYLKTLTKKVYLGFCVNHYRSVCDGISTFYFAKVQTYDSLYGKGIATIMSCHKILRLMELCDDTFAITAILDDDAKAIWNNGQPHTDGTPSFYIYKKIFQHEAPFRISSESRWQDKIVFDINNREEDQKYYKDLFESKVKNLKI